MLILKKSEIRPIAGQRVSSLFRMATRVAKILAAVSSRQLAHRRLSPGRLVRPLYSQLSQRLETLIGAGPFLIRAIDNVLDRWRQWSG